MQKEEENIQHLFLECMFTKNTFVAVTEQFNSGSFYFASSGSTVRSLVENWVRVHSLNFPKLYLPFFTLWSIWKHRNLCIFEGKTPAIYPVLHHIELLFHSYPVPLKKLKHRLIGMPPNLEYPCVFFDGVAAKNMGGGRICSVLE